MEQIYNSMSRNRQLFLTEMITGMGQYTLVSGAFLAGFIDLLGGSDSLNGTMGAIPAVMGFMQVISSLYFERMDQRKKPMMKIIALLRLALSLIYIIPVLLIPTGISLQMVVVLYIVAFALNGLLSPVLMEWLVVSTPNTIRGQYFAKRDRYGFAVSVVLSFSAGKLLDYYEIIDLEAQGFLFIGAIVLILGVINYVSVHKMEELSHDYVPQKYQFKDAVKIPLANPGFKMVIALFSIWNLGLQMGGPFIAVYMVAHLDLSYTYVMIITIIGTVLRVLTTPLWGKVADRKSWYLAAEGSVLLLAMTHISWAFVDHNNVAVMAPILSLTGGFAWAGAGISMFNIPFMFATKQGRTMFIGLNAAIGGIISLVAVRFGGHIIDILEGQIVKMGPFNFNNIQFVLFVSSLILMGCPLFIRFVLRRFAHHQTE